MFQDLEEQIAQDDGTAQALRADTLKQENALQQLRRAVKEVAFFKKKNVGSLTIPIIRLSDSSD